LAGTSSSAFVGGLLLFSYAVGLSVPLLLVSTYLERVDRSGRLWRFIKGKMIVFDFGEGKYFRVHSSALISGLLFIILGFLIFSGQLFVFNQYAGSTGFQQWIFGLEERLLRWLG